MSGSNTSSRKQAYLVKAYSPRVIVQGTSQSVTSFDITVQGPDGGHSDNKLLFGILTGLERREYRERAR